MVTGDQVAALAYAVRSSVVLKYVGQLALALAVLQVVPLGVALYYGDYAVALRLVIVVLVLGGVGALLSRYAAPSRIQANEALAIIALAYVLGGFAMTFPMMAAGLTFGDALFESISGVTTTGLSTVVDVQAMPRAFLFQRAWTQWYGGLGIVILSVALLIGYDVAARRLVEPAPTGETLITTTRVHARRVLVIYFALTALAIACLSLLGMDGFDAVVHALAAVSTGGFSPLNESLASFGSWSIRTAAMCFGLLGAVSLPLYYRTYHGQWREVVRDYELQSLFMAVIVVGMVLALLSWWHAHAISTGRLAHVFLLGMSAQTTTGFSTLPVAQLDPASKLVLIIAMATGGCVGSTAGGIKLLRLLLLLRLLQLLFRRLAMPSHAVAELYVGKRRVESDELVRALLLILLFVGAVLLSWIPFVALGYDSLDSLFEVVSAMGTVGLSAGVTAADLGPWLKGVLCVDMLLGRLEFVAMLILFYPRTWIGRRAGGA